MTVDINVIVVAGITALAPTIIALAALVQAIRTHSLVNSRMTQLLELARKEAITAATLAAKEAAESR